MNWGVLGCANIAQRSMIPAILSIEENELIAVASRKMQTAHTTAEKFNCTAIEGYDALLEVKEIDAVYIPLPNSLHFEWVMKTLEKGKHVLVEKSAGVSLAEVGQMIALAKKNQLALVENFLFLHHSQHQFVKNLLAEGEIGEIRGFRSSFGFPPFEETANIRYKKELGGGSLLDAGAYTLKATNFIMGEGFEVRGSYLQMHPHYKVDWFGSALLVNEKTGMASEVAFGFDNYYQCNYEIWGSKGKITSTRAFTAKPDFAPTIILEKNGTTNEISLDPDDHFHNMLVYFNQLIQSSNPNAEYEQILEQARLLEQVRLQSQISSI